MIVLSSPGRGICILVPPAESLRITVTTDVVRFFIPEFIGVVRNALPGIDVYLLHILMSLNGIFPHDPLHRFHLPDIIAAIVANRRLILK